MPDDPRANQPSPDSPDELNLEGAHSEEELDELLAEAAALATDIADEVGTGDNQPAAERPDPVMDLDSQELDEELKNLEGLVARTASELDADSPQPTENKAGEVEEETPAIEEPPKAKKAAPPATADVPDFMREFMEPETPTAKSTESTESTEKPAPAPEENPPEPQSAADSVPDFMKEFTEPSSTNEPPTASGATSPTDRTPKSDKAVTPATIPRPKASPRPGVVGTGISVEQEPDTAPEPVAPHAVPEPPPDDVLEAAGREEQRAPVLLVRLRGMLTMLGLLVGRKVVNLLELIDRPLSRLGSPIRHVIGLVAIATLGTAIVVFIITMF